MTDCPHCKKEIIIPEISKMSLDAYGNEVLTITECCGKGVFLTPVRSFNVRLYIGTKTEDDWGRKFT